MTTYEKIGRIIGGILAVTITVCAWVLIIAFTLKCLWFILFRFLV